MRLPPLVLRLARTAALPAALGCASSTSPVTTAPPRTGPAVLVASFDALNADRARTTLPAEAIPTFTAFFTEASCADGARPMFPSVTAAGHSALWTGAWGRSTGIAGNQLHPLPTTADPITRMVSGYDAAYRNAEPIWITASRAGLDVVAHHATQSPGPGGHRRADGSRDTMLLRRELAELSGTRLFVLNGYDRDLEPLRVHRLDGWRVVGPRSWGEVRRLDRSLARERSWTIAGDSVHALLPSPEADTLWISRTRRLTDAVAVTAAPEERDPVAGRALARHFSAPMRVTRGEARSAVFFRWWRGGSGDAGWLYQSEAHVVNANDARTLDAYLRTVGAFVGNSAAWSLRDGALGRTINEGGDGTAEFRYLETAELLVRQFMRGTEWSWRTRRPALQLDYLPLIDDLDHLWLGDVSPEAPGTTAAQRAAINAMRARGWTIADRRLAHLRSLAEERGALLIISGDHGMRPTWRNFHANRVLLDAGLLAVDSAGRVVPERSSVVSPNGYWLTVNRRARFAGGLVEEAEVPALLDRAERALVAARDDAGVPIVTRTWRPQPDDTLGIGGPSGGDLYFALAPGTSYAASVAPSAVMPRRGSDGSHGFPSVDVDMRTVLCAEGPGIGRQRLPTARLVDVAPTASAWLGIPAPPQSEGTSLLEAMRQR